MTTAVGMDDRGAVEMEEVSKGGHGVVVDACIALLRADKTKRKGEMPASYMTSSKGPTLLLSYLENGVIATKLCATL